MTAKHMLEGVMQWTRSRSHHQCAVFLGLDPASVSRLHKGKQTGLTIATLDQIQRRAEVPIDTLWAWYRLPHDAVLGRVSRADRSAQ
jgi:DNA-binding Xre family transcriptional regulator